MEYLTKENEKKAKPSTYRPNKKTREVHKMVLSDYETGYENLTKPFEEFNNRSLLGELNQNQKLFNTYQKPKSIDPDYSWTSNAVSPASRNKIISIVAHLTGSILYPNIYAQNDRQEEDKEASKAMRDLLEWVIDNSNYSLTFLYAVISACVNPAVIIHEEFVQTFRTIKVVKETGGYEKQRILDEVLSGFIQTIVPNDELLIENIYEKDIQRQGFLIWRKVISYNLAKRKFSDKPNFKFIQPGIQVLYNSTNDTFYEAYNESMQARLAEQVVYYNAAEDLKLTFVNGVLMDSYDNPNPRQDKMYPFAKTIYEPISPDGRFFYGKSLANKLKPEQEVIDQLYKMIVDGTYLDVWKPLAVSSKDGFDSSIVAPGKVTVMGIEDKITPINVGSNLTAAYNTKIEVERNLTESSSSVQQQGISAKGSQTAYEISKLEENAQVMLGFFGKMIGQLVRDLGLLIGTDILQYLTIGEMKEISGKDELVFKKFNLDKVIKGKRKTQILEFDNSIPEEMTEEELERRSFSLLDEEGGLDSDKEITKILPGIFRNRKFLFKVDYDSTLVKSEALKRAFNLELYDRAIQNPILDQEAITKDFLLGSYEQSKDRVDDYIKDEPLAMQAGIGEAQTTPMVDQLAKKDIKMSNKTLW